MREDMYTYLGCGDGLRRIPNRDAYKVVFEFSVTPAEYFGQPDEAQYVEQRNVEITVAGRATRSGAIPKGDRDKMAVLYWHAVKTIEAGQDSLEINVEYASAHPVDPSKIEYPPTRAFPVFQVQKMGFR